MKKEIREVNTEKGITRVTVADERWYMREVTDPITGLPVIKAVPSVTWIAGFYPKGIGFYKWLAEHGWDEAESIKTEAGEKGSKVHQAITAIIEGKEVRIDSKFPNSNTGVEEELTLEEVDAIVSFVQWKNEVEKDYTIEGIAHDHILWSDKHNYAGTLDWLINLVPKGEKNDMAGVWIIDFKTSQSVWPSHEIQISMYKETIENGENGFTYKGKVVNVSGMRMLVLQVGYRRNRNLYKVNVIEDRFPLALHAQGIWKHETEGEAPKVRDYPIVISPAVKVVVTPIVKSNEKQTDNAGPRPARKTNK